MRTVCARCVGGRPRLTPEESPREVRLRARWACYSSVLPRRVDVRPVFLSLVVGRPRLERLSSCDVLSMTLKQPMRCVRHLVTQSTSMTRCCRAPRILSTLILYRRPTLFTCRCSIRQNHCVSVLRGVSPSNLRDSSRLLRLPVRKRIVRRCV